MSLGSKQVFFFVLLFVALACDVQEETIPTSDVAQPMSPRQKANIEKEKLASIESKLDHIEQDVNQATKEGDRVRAKQLIDVGLNVAAEQGPGFELNQARLILAAGNLARERGNEIEARRDRKSVV